MNMVALVDGQPRVLNLKELLECVHLAPARGRHAAHGVRAAQGARARPRAGRPGGGAVQRRRGDRADQEGAHAAEAKARPHGARLGSPSCDEMLTRPGAKRRTFRPEGCDGLRPEGRRLTSCPRSRRRHPRAAPAAPDRARAGQDPRRVPRSDRRRSPTCSTSSPSRRASPKIIGDELAR